MDYKKQTEVFNPDKFNTPVHIIGCGATGSWVALEVAKLGCKNIHLHDFDEIEEHNIPNQAFKLADVGKSKVDALAQLLTEMAGITPTVHKEAVTGDTKLSGIVFMLTDTMVSRTEIFKKALRYNLSVPCMIETRMGLEGGRIYAINPADNTQIKEYNKTLYTDEESVESMCGISQTLGPTAMLVASYAVWQLIKWFNHDEIDNEIIVDAKYNNMLTRRF